MGLLQLLAKLFGKSYLNKIMGTRTNVAKPIRMDNNSPFKKYSDDAFNDPKALDYIENKIDEYGPYALSNKNPQELANFEENAKRLLAAKNKQTGTTQGMVIMSDLLKMTDDNLNALAKEGNDLKAKRILTGDDRERLNYIDNILEEAQKLPNTGKGLAEDIKAAGGKPEAEIIDIGTGKKIDDEGIMSLKERAPQINTKASANLKEDIAKLTEREARAYSANIESFRRPIIRQMLLKDTKIKLPDDVRKSLENKMDLDKGADPEMDPLRLLNKYYDVDFNKLDELEEIRFTARNETEAADEFLQKGGLEPKKTKTVEEFIDDGDFDPGGMANGGRIGFAGGGIKALIAMMNKKFGKDAVKTADEVKPSEFKAFKTEKDFDNLSEKLKLEEEFKAFNKRTDNSISKAMDEVGGNFTGDMKYDADVLADEIAFQRGLIPEGGDLTDIADQMKRMDIYDEAYSAVSKQFLKNREIKKAKLSYADKDKRMIPEGLTEEGIDLSILKRRV